MPPPAATDIVRYRSSAGRRQRGIATFARKLKRDHRALIGSSPFYRKHGGQFLTALLPPKPRRRGRPGRPEVTQAIRLLRVFRQQYPDETAAEQWARMYAVVIPGYGEMNPVEQRDAQEHLRERVPWRRRQSSLTAQLGRDGKVRADETRRLARTQPARARVSFFFLRILGQRLHYTVMEHLSDHDLERYHLGMVVHEAELAPLEEHLLSCPECAARAEEVAEYVDTLRTAIIAGNFDFD